VADLDALVADVDEQRNVEPLRMEN
jgi:hypothetical protein